MNRLLLMHLDRYKQTDTNSRTESDVSQALLINLIFTQLVMSYEAQQCKYNVDTIFYYFNSLFSK